MQWMEIAWAEVGTCEIQGPDAHPAILGYFREVGRDDITSDETAWCMAFALACLSRAGIPVTVPKGDRLLARSALQIGAPIETPRVGAVAVFSRGTSGWQGHVGFVTAWTDTHIKLLGGNQSNAVNEKWYSRDELLGLRWPGVAVTAGDLKQAGSTTITKSDDVRDSGIKSILSHFMGQMAPDSDASQVLTTARTGRQMVDAFADFAQYFWVKWPWIAAAVGFYYLVRMLWHIGWIKSARVNDHNDGSHTGRAVDGNPPGAFSDAKNW